MKSGINKFLICIFLISVVIIFSTSAMGEDINISQGVEQGLNNNYELEQIKQNIISLKRNIKVIEASLDWQMGINNNYYYGNSNLQNYNINDKDNYNTGFNLEAGTSSFTGYNIQSRLAFTDNLSDGLNNIDEKCDINLNISKKLYPVVPIEEKRDYLSIKNELRIAQEKLLVTRKGKKKEWYNDYYELIRLKELLQVVKEKKDLASKYLDIVKKEKSIGETGKQQLLMAAINLKEVEMEYQQSNFTFVQAQKSLQEKLGLSEANELLINLDFKNSNNFLLKLEKFKKDLYNESSKRFIKLIKDTNLDLKEIELAIKYAKEKYKWQQAESMIKVTANGEYNKSYGNDEDYWTIGLNFSYDLLDGGLQELALEEIQAEINSLKSKYDKTLAGLKTELWSILEQINLNDMAMNTAELKVDKKVLEKEMYKKQYKNGLINKYKYEQKLLEYNEAKINLKSAQDKLIFSKLQLINFLGLL